MTVQSRSVHDRDAEELNGKSVLAAGSSERRVAGAGTRSRRDDDQSVRKATRQLFVGLALAAGVVPAS